MRKRTRYGRGAGLSDVAVAIGVLAVLLVAVTTAIETIVNGRVNGRRRAAGRAQGCGDQLAQQRALQVRGHPVERTLGLKSKAKEEPEMTRFSEGPRTSFRSVSGVGSTPLLLSA